MGTERFPEGFIEMVRKAQIEAESAWHLDKRVPIALIVSILMQTGGIVWWGATANERLNSLERKADAAATQPERLARVETKLESVQDGIAEIKAILRKEPTPPPKGR